MTISSALRIAISLHLMPAQHPKIKAAPLPDDIEILLLIAAGNEDEIQKATQSTHHPKETVQKAATFFVENIMLSPDADYYRILGANPNASTGQLRRNMALIMRYLHPDVSQNENTALITRVTQAWNTLKTDDKRAAYDLQYRQKITSPVKPLKPSPNNKKKAPSAQKHRQRQQSEKRFGYRRQWKGMFLRQLTLFLMKISGRGS